MWHHIDPTKKILLSLASLHQVRGQVSDECSQELLEVRHLAQLHFTETDICLNVCLKGCSTKFAHTASLSWRVHNVFCGSVLSFTKSEDTTLLWCHWGVIRVISSLGLRGSKFITFITVCQPQGYHAIQIIVKKSAAAQKNTILKWYTHVPRKYCTR